MGRTVIHTRHAPSSPSYSQACRAGGLVFVSGTPGIDVTTGEPAGDTIEEQSRQAVSNCEQVLRAAGTGLDRVVDVHVLLARPEDADAFDRTYRQLFPDDPPARCISRLGVDRAGILVSVKMTAAV